MYSNNRREEANNLINKCISLANAFDKFQRMRSDDLKEEEIDLDIILPYVILHAKDNRTLFQKFQNRQPSFRINSMISIFNAQPEPIDENASLK